MKSLLKKICLIYVLLLSTSLVAEPSPFNIDKLASGIKIPWGMTWIAQDKLLITQRGGSIVLLDTVSGKVSPVSGEPKVSAKGQGGLLDVVASPDFKNTGWLYFTYVKPLAKGGVTVLARAKFSSSHAKLNNWQDLVISKSATDTSRHFGSRIAFDGAGHVFFSIGDRGVRDNAQNTLNHAGAILRLNLDGSVPKDNPFIGQKGYLPEIYSYGHRNPQGLAFDRATKQLWAIEHGPRGGDEINLVLAGKNYGWPITSHGKEYWGPIAVGEGQTKIGIEAPKKVYIPSIAPSSLLLYQGAAFKKWQGDLLAGALKLTHINHMQIKAGELVNERRYLESHGQRIRNIISDERGRLIIATDNGDILRLSAL